jgi:predicted ATPase
LSPKPNAPKAEAYFDAHSRSIVKQQAKSWELRRNKRMARLWRDQGKHREARGLLAPIYGSFTEGFDTLDLKEAKKLLDELQHAHATRLGIASSQP